MTSQHLFTIGYGGRAPADLVATLQAHGVATVVDVRAVPQRAFLGAYVRARSPDRGIVGLLARAGVGYVWLDALGNPFRGEATWRARYADLLAASGAARTAPLATVPGPFALLCAERDHRDCHRTLIAEWLAPRGWSATHL